MAAADKTNSIRTSIISGLWTNSRGKAIAFAHSPVKFIKINDLQCNIYTSNKLGSRRKVIHHGILFTASISFLKKNQPAKKGLK
ncbi:hypothetical protein [Janthinobacterium sp. GW458P]|uniref:hypothetical protein n=1 Tax=Janthinobacterium sp. GW458P TaxID=1981504 RepID=UPI0011215496|nr:hypothetical protein [Janthinobacterium sp. GW458P]MBE3025665.1 hypothetical protein [Janthinobacterium sp. GW458P]